MATQLNNWLSIDNISGTGNAEITLTASSYEELVDRTTSLKIQGISANAILNVRQNALVPKIEVEGDLVFPSYGGERTIRIKSNIGWRIENGDWYNFNITQGNANVFTNVTITVDSNGGDERSVEIPIYKSDGVTIIGYITLTQNNANLTVEVPTDVENCFYIEPTVTDGRVIDIQFGYSRQSSTVSPVESYIFYYEDSTWKTFKPATAWDEFPILKTQKRVYFKEFYRRNTYQGWYLKFNITGEVNVGGDLSVLLGDVENPYGYNTNITSYATYLFNDCPIVNASQLVLPTKMNQLAYAYMFAGCEKLIAVPELPATTLAENCYQGMFQGCTSLTTAPVLPATDLEEGCYGLMFDGCGNLEAAPVLPARILKDNCYAYMFFNCGKLSHIEMLGLVIGNESLYSWVRNVAPTGTFIKADNVILEAGENGIPDGWSITESVYSPTVEELKSSYLWVEFEDEGGYVGRFYYGIVYSFDGINWIRRTSQPFGIDMESNKIVYLASTKSSLNENTGTYYSITFSSGKAKISGELTKIGRRDKYTNLFKGNEGLTDASELILPTTLSEECFKYMFRDCTSLVNSPQLPATVLAQGCYNGMFLGCTSLTTAPVLPATTLVDECYESMFGECSNLNYIKMLGTNIGNNSLYIWVSGVQTTEGTFVKHPDANLPTGTSGIPDGWTVETATS